MANAGASAKAVDFSNVKDRGNFNPKQVPAGDYAARVVKVEDNESKKDGSFQYLFTIKLEKFSQNSYAYYCKLSENQLWKLRNLAMAAGLNVPKRRVKFDPNKIVGKMIGVTMEDDEYEGKVKSVIDAVFPVSELADNADIDTSDEEDDGEYEPEDTSVPVEDEEEADDEATDSDDTEEEETPAPKKGKKEKGKKDKGDKKSKKAAKPAADDDDDDEIDIDDL